MNLLGLLLVTMLPAAPRPAVFQTEQFVYVSAVEGRDVRTALQRLRQSLKAARLAPADVVSVTVYRTDREQGTSFEKEWRSLFKGDPPAQTELLATLTGDARVAVSTVAARRGVAKRSIQGRAVEAGGTLFLPGLIARSAASGTIEEQTLDVMRQQEELLQAAGFSFADLVVARIYLSEPSDYSGLNEGYRKFVTAPPPARATVHVSPVVPGQRIQIQSVAVKGSGIERPSGPGITSPIHSYSVKAGRLLYITGMTGRRSDGLFPKDLAGPTASQTWWRRWYGSATRMIGPASPACISSEWGSARRL